MAMIRARGKYESGGKKMVQRRMRVLVRVHRGCRSEQSDAKCEEWETRLI